MKWIPSWLAEKYSLIHLVRGVNTFDFDEAKKFLGIEDKRVVSIILTQLRKRGFLISWRDSVDPRRKLFRLIPPESAIFAFGIENSAEDKSIEGKLQESLKHLEYVVGGAWASFRYHGYSVPGKLDLHVKREDLDKWVALLTEPGVAISIDDILAERPGKDSVHIHSDLTDDTLDESVVIDRIRYLRPEALAVEGIASEDSFSLMDALAILIVKRNELDWGELLQLAERGGVTRQLGCTLEMINYEAGREVFSESRIKKMRERADLSRLMTFPKTVEVAPFKKEEKEYYEDLGKKWNVKIYLSRAFVSKIVSDLVR